MQKEPFIITLGNEDLPNLSSAGKDDFGFEFNKTNLWQENSTLQLEILQEISRKLDIISELLKKNGKE